MSNKQIVSDLLQRIPEDASLHDIAREIEFIAAVRQGLAELDRGERIPIEEVERELPSWIIKQSSRPPPATICGTFVHYISLDAPDRALRFGQFLVTQTKTLARFPELGRIVPEFGDPVIREIIARAYRVVYRVNHPERLVEVIRFWHAARGTPQLSKI